MTDENDEDLSDEELDQLIEDAIADAKKSCLAPDMPSIIPHDSFLHATERVTTDVDAGGPVASACDALTAMGSLANDGASDLDTTIATNWIQGVETGIALALSHPEYAALLLQISGEFESSMANIREAPNRWPIASAKDVE